MKITFEHVFGKQTTSDIICAIIRAEISSEEEGMALENGWLYDPVFNWYQCRSTRINLSKYISKHKWPDNLEFKVVPDDFDSNIIEKIYQDYIAYKKFKPHYPNIKHNTQHKEIFGVVFDSGVAVAFTKFTEYNGGLESGVFCWNYHKPNLRIGRLIQDKEVEYAKSLGLTHLYIGQGYEKNCIYKAKFPGFEWWTGKEWSSNTEQYIKLCERDSTLELISDLGNSSLEV
jgi:hypothetical protein